MATKTQKAKVGAFLIVSFVLMAIGAVYLAGYYEDRGVPYWISFDESVLGLYEGGLVEYLGLPVGQVQSMRVTEGNRARVDIVINPSKVTLNAGVRAQLVLYSLAAGTMAVELSGGDAGAGRLKPGSQIFTVPSKIASISTEIEDLIKYLSRIAKLIDSSLIGIEEGDISEILAKAATLLDEGKMFLADGRVLVRDANGALSSLSNNTGRITEEFVVLGENMSALTQDIADLVNTVRGKVEQFDMENTQEQLNHVLTNMANLSERLNATMMQFEVMSANAMHEADNIEHSLREALREMREAFVSVNTLVDQLKADPASLVRGKGELREPRP